MAVDKLRELWLSTVEVRMPHLDRSGGMLSDRVAALERREKELTGLCGQMIATMLVNMQSGRLTTQNDDEFVKMIDAWSERMMKA